MKPTIALLTTKDSEEDRLIAVGPEALQTQGCICSEDIHTRWGWRNPLNKDRDVWGKELDQLKDKGWRFEYVKEGEVQEVNFNTAEVQWLLFKNAAELSSYVENQKPE